MVQAHIRYCTPRESCLSKKYCVEKEMNMNIFQHVFEQLPGLKIGVYKSQIFYSNTKRNHKQKYSNSLV